MMALFETKRMSLTWVEYSAMPSADILVWEARGNTLNKEMLFLMNLKNNNANKDLCLAYSQGNMTTYPSTIKGMTRYLSTQYSNKNSANQPRW